MTGLRVVGLDLSLTSTGVALPDGSTVALAFRGRITAAPTLRRQMESIEDYGRARREYQRTELLEILRSEHVDLIASEMPYISHLTQPTVELIELHGMVRDIAERRDIPWTGVSPSTLKQFATGNGGADKPMMASALSTEHGLTAGTDDEVDAMWLQIMAVEYYDGCMYPATPAKTARGKATPHPRTKAFASVRWPFLMAAAA